MESKEGWEKVDWNSWQSEAQARDIEAFEQACYDFYLRWSPKMGPEDAELLRRCMAPSVKTEAEEKPQMPLGWGGEPLFI